MSISGNLETMQLAELLQWLSQGQKTGTLYIDRGDVEKRIFFENGKIISTASTDPKEFLGHFLVSFGFLDEVTLAKAIEMQSTSKMLLGKILTTISVISESELEEMLRLKAEETIYEIFGWKAGEFNFRDGELPDVPMVPLSIDVTGLVLEGMHRVDQWNRIRSRIASNQGIPVSVGDLVATEDDPQAIRILASIDDDRTIEEISLQTHASEFHVCRVLFDQMEEGRLKIVRPRFRPEDAQAVSEDSTTKPSILVAAAQEFLDENELEMALRHAHAARILEPQSKQIENLTRSIEREILARVEADGVTSESVPKLDVKMEDIANLNLSPEEGFVLSRVDGIYDIGTLVKISPIPALDARVVFWRLLTKKHITLLPPRPKKS